MNSLNGMLVLSLLLPLIAPTAIYAQAVATDADYKTVRNISYREDSTAPDQPSGATGANCQLDLHHPAGPGAKGFATVVWFHGGGLTQGIKEIPEALQRKGFAVAGAGYRLCPAVKARDCIADAAAAVAWVLRHIDEYGGDSAKVYVSGHSAGGYLASMVAIDERWLAAEKLDFRKIAGAIPYSGQAITHFRIRAERGIADTCPVIDDLAPVYHVRKDAPPFLLITGDREKEMLGRYEETAYFWRMLRVVGHPAAELVEFEGRDHMGMIEPAHDRLVEFLGSRGTSR